MSENPYSGEELLPLVMSLSVMKAEQKAMMTATFSAMKRLLPAVDFEQYLNEFLDLAQRETLVALEALSSFSTPDAQKRLAWEMAQVEEQMAYYRRHLG